MHPQALNSLHSFLYPYSFLRVATSAGINTTLLGPHRCLHTDGAERPCQPQEVQQAKRLGLKDVQHIVAVTSAKGGVGKSTTAANLSVALATALGQRVGLLDADIHGPSIPQLMNLQGQPVTSSAGPQPLLVPKENYRVKCMSFGFFLKGDEPVVWRGPMVNQAFDKLLFGTDWGQLDVLVVDMPPGTGDAQINLGQRIPLSGAVLVSTPQDLAMIDVRRGAAMFQKLRVPLLGLVENMAFHTCSKCGHREAVFGEGGVDKGAADLAIPVLGRMPLVRAIMAMSDKGTPITAAHPSSNEAQAYISIARQVMQGLAHQAIKCSPAGSGLTANGSKLGPVIVVED